ncbi:MAG TPA: phenylalanine 4-monooxygenase [Terriglobales bacterium]|nr:phenylalanine 4-monooxygenase [Terriglobales bacterium]
MIPSVPSSVANPAALDPTLGLRGDYSRMDANWVTAQNWDDYTAAEHDLWRQLYARQVVVARKYAANAFLTGLKTLQMPEDRIPHFEEASEKLHALTGWTIVAVPGLIPEDAFFLHLAKRQFPVTVWLRRPDEIDYLVEPDVFHDFFGHVPLLSQPVFADYLQEYGRKGIEAIELGTTKMLTRLFWYMVEFGLIRGVDGIKAYGAGMLSSATETAFSVASKEPHRIKFDLMRIMHTDYRIDSFQQSYFVIDDFQELFAAMQQPFAPVYDLVKPLPLIPANSLLDTDTVLQVGTQSGQQH